VALYGKLTRALTFENFRHTPLNVALPPASRFWHIGTIPEVLDHFCYRTSFLFEAAGGGGGGGGEGGNGGGGVVEQGAGEPGGAAEEVGLSVGACVRGGMETPHLAMIPNNPAPFEFCVGPQGLGFYVVGAPAACEICSRVAPSAIIGARSVVEFSSLEEQVRVGRDCFLSSVTLPPCTHIPDGCLIQTLCLQQSILASLQLGGEGGGGEEEPKFVTQIMGTNDDVKKSGDLSSVYWMGRSLKHVCQTSPAIPGVEPGRIWPNGASFGTLWTARIFPVCKDRETSLQAALALLTCGLDGGEREGGGSGSEGSSVNVRGLRVSVFGDWSHLPRVSFQDCIKAKHPSAQQVPPPRPPPRLSSPLHTHTLQAHIHT
jgi:hypothetical protein